jgi:type I restriction enzyme S subunit
MTMPPANWKPAKLDELGFVSRGKSRHRPRNAAFLYGGPYPFFQTGDIKAANLHLTEHTQTYSEDGLAQSRLWKPGTLCITIAANIAESAILAVEGCFPDSVVGFVAHPNKADVRFIKYYMDTLKLQMQSVSRGTTQDNLSLDKLLTFDFHVPPLPVQRRIAGILSAYDELIENSQRRIKILEAMARGLYREWFVHFRFPGHHNHPLVASPVGDIPKGWEVRRVAEFADFVRGFEPGSGAYQKEPREDSIKFLRVGDLSKRDSDLYIAERLAEGRVLAPFDIAITFDGSVGQVRLGLHGAYSSGIRRVNVKDSSRLGWSFAYQLLLSDATQATIQAHAKGTTIKHAGTAVAALEFVSPPQAIIEMFERLTAPMLRCVLSLRDQIDVLRRTRDLVLPRLLSGQIELEAA